MWRRSVYIRYARRRHQQVVASIVRRSFAKHKGRWGRTPKSASVDPGAIREEMQAKGRKFGIAYVRQGGRFVPAGVVAYRLRWSRIRGGVRSDEARLVAAVSHLAVLEGFARHRLGRRLMLWAEEQARARAAVEVRGQVWNGLPSLVRYYRRLGYRTYRTPSGATIAYKPL